MTALISSIIATVAVSVVSKHAKLKALVISINLQCIKGAEAIDKDRFEVIYCTCQMQWYTIAMMLLTLLGIVYMVTSKLRKSPLPRGHLFSNMVKVVIFILDTLSYVPVNAKEKLYLGCIGYRLERSQHDFEWEQN